VLADNNISQCVFSYEYGMKLSEYATFFNVSINTHIKVDTGMGRIGFKCNQESWNSIVEVCNLPNLKHEGIFTHFAVADEGDNGKAYTERQFRKFKDTIDFLTERGISFQLRHCANSAGIFDYPEMHLDMVRAGIVLYGLQPSGDLRNPGKLERVMEVKTIVDHLKTVETDTFISYGREFKATRDLRIATIPIGYADGVSRGLSNKISGIINGKKIKQIGNITMDQMMFDLGDTEAQVGDVITLLDDEELSLDNWAEILHTINYELTCRLKVRLPRVYVR
jgi:alanine racemase